MNGDGYSPAACGCTVCGTQDTATVDGIHGRRCALHVPPGAAHLLGDYQRDAALRQVDAGNPAGAFAWLRAHLTRKAAA